MKKLNQLLAIIFILCVTPTLLAATFVLNKKGNDMVGKIQTAIVHKGDDFAKIARKYDVGYYQLIEANPADYFWGEGKDGSGKNMMGRILMEIRAYLKDKNK